MRISKTQLDVLRRMDSGALLYGSVYPDPYSLQWLSESGNTFKHMTVRITTIMALKEKGFIREVERKPTQPYWREDYELTEAGRALLAGKEENDV